MKINETIKVLNLLAASESKVQVWMKLDGKTIELTHDRQPMLASDALLAVRAAHNTASSFGKEAEFGLRRFEVAA